MYAKDFEEIMKAIIVRNTDTFRYFQQYANGATRINKELFRSALFNLSLEYLKATDIDAIFDALDGMRQGIIDINQIDDAIRKNCNKTQQQMYDDVMEKIVTAFNGDDGFLLT